MALYKKQALGLAAALTISFAAAPHASATLLFDDFSGNSAGDITGQSAG